MSNASISIKRISYRSEEYWAVLEVRRQVLRLPIGRDFSETDIALEADQYHLGAFDGERAIGSLLLRRSDNEAVMVMRQVSVAAEYQGRGVGKLLVAACEDWSAELGAKTIELHARSSAVPFYEAMGYVARGEEFEEVGLPHFEMAKNLSSTHNSAC